MNTSTKPTLNEAENGNKSKPLLSSRLFKFRAWDGKEMLKDIIPMNNYAITRVQGLENTTSYCYYVPVEEIMQFTGLKDRNDVEIYEGDILYFDDDCTMEKVYYENGCFGTMGRYNFISLMDTNMNIAKIIGNVFQNPELL